MAYESKYENPSTLKMDYVHTEAHQMAYDLSVYLHRKVRDMPHYEKFTLQNLTVEGIKKLLDKKSVDYSSNVMAAVTAVVISVALSAGYLIYTETMLNAKIGVELIALAYLSFLVATNGYDKVIQAIKQIKQIEKQ